MINPNARNHTLHRCDVCDKDIVDGDEAQITAETILCEECLRKVTSSLRTIDDEALGRRFLDCTETEN